MSVTPQLFPTGDEAVKGVGKALRLMGREQYAAKWQSVDAPAPMLELMEVAFRFPVLAGLNELAGDINPNHVWADLHFAERVSRIPSNPGTAYKFWPYFKVNKDLEDQALQGKAAEFTHTYQERIWPKEAGTNHQDHLIQRHGLRYALGDLDDVVQLLREQPNTRQAYLPIFFPEDTGAVHRGRIPCTLGYLFQMRGGFLHMSYYIRSCDYFRHFRGDIYLAGRLLQWVLEQLEWKDVQPGMLNMYASSMHCWLSERELLPK